MRIVFVNILFFILYSSQGQDIIIQPPVIPPFGCNSFYELYTGTVQNFSKNTFKTYMYVEINYTATSMQTIRLADVLLRGNPSADFTPGITIVNGVNVDVIFPNRRIRFNDKSLEEQISRTKCLPAGQYEVCLTLYEEKGGDINNPTGPFLTQTCYERSKEYLNNLFLVSPFDNTELQQRIPLFTWTPVLPYQVNGRYELKLVEVLDHQSSYDALVSNPLFYYKTDILNNIHQYDLSSRLLDSCKNYAWQVIYSLKSRFGDNQFKKAPAEFQHSEIWTFTTPCSQTNSSLKESFSYLNPVYYRLLTKEEGTYHIVNSEYLRFVIDYNYKSTNSVKYQIKDEKDNIIVDNEQVYREEQANQYPALPVNKLYGDRKYILKLPSTIQLNTNYTITILGLKDKLHLRFVRK